jgi:hypothetical protein
MTDSRRQAVAAFDERTPLVYGAGDVRVEDVPDGDRAMADARRSRPW